MSERDDGFGSSHLPSARSTERAPGSTADFITSVRVPFNEWWLT